MATDVWSLSLQRRGSEQAPGLLGEFLNNEIQVPENYVFLIFQHPYPLEKWKFKQFSYYSFYILTL